MKMLKNILSWIIIILLGVMYMIDRIILVSLPWIEVKSIQDWMPKHTEFDIARKEFPTLSDEAIQEICDHRKYMKDVLKVSVIRVAVATFIAMCVYVICM